ncbi:ArsB/NhaD family transporter [Salinisphaera sp. LB1]|uniref:ArsB/NhaD family transporter n=1 Tax=Salinisphaera sp. LB1 TaxID=2183911 RepID=UPI000D7D2AFD|nr:hypothetical protein SALB1_0595 [Salinisphaera sp. LB1]
MVVTQPRELGIGWSTTGGALVSLAVGMVSLDVATVGGRRERHADLRRDHRHQSAVG